MTNEEHQSTFQCQMAPENCYGHCLVIFSSFIGSAFLNSRETVIYEKYVQQTDDRCQNQQCLQSPQCVRKAQFKTKLDGAVHNQHFIRLTNCTIEFCSICDIHLTSCQPTTISSRISATFARETLPQSTGRRNAFQESIKSWSMYSHAKKQANLFLIDKNVLTTRVLLLLNKDMFQPSHNDLKFMENCISLSLTGLFSNIGC